MRFGTGLAWAFVEMLAVLAGSAQAEHQQTTHAPYSPSISADGKILAFYSQSVNWGAGGFNAAYKVFVYHRERHRVLNLSRNGPHYANYHCWNPRVSADGRQVIYQSDADNLIGGITNAFVVTNGYGNLYACALGEDDFSEPAPGLTHRLINVSPSGQQANRSAEYPVCSSNGRFVAFQTKAWNLDPDAPDTNYNEAVLGSGMDIYLRDRDFDGNGVFDEEGPGATRTLRISRDNEISVPHSAWYPSISADGQTLAYALKRTGPYQSGQDLGVVVYKLAEQTYTLYAPGTSVFTGEPRLSPDATHLIAQSWPEWAVARTIMYRLPDTNWWYAATPLDSPTGVHAYACEVATGGHDVVFTSANTNLVANDRNNHFDVFVRVSNSGQGPADRYELVSVSSAGVQGDADSGGDDENRSHVAALSWNGRYVAFMSLATNLVPVDTNGVGDIFIRDRWSNTTEIVAQKVSAPVFPAGAALTVSQVTNTSAFFQWTAATDVYPLWEYRLTLTSSFGSTQVVAAGSSTNRLVTGLRAGTAYTAALEACDGAGNCSEPLSASFTTTGRAPTMVPNDYNGDGRSDLAVYDSYVGTWYAYSLASGQAVIWGKAWGWPGAETVPGDYDGDAVGDLAVYDQGSGMWYVWSEHRQELLLWAKAWGWTGARTVPGDYNGDAVSDLAVYDQNTGYWYITTAADVVLAWQQAWGWPGAITVPGDYNGDAVSDLCVYDSTTGYWFSQTIGGTPILWQKAWGWPGATTVPGDYDGDAVSDLAVYDQPSGSWYVWSEHRQELLVWAQAWGWPGAVPVPGDYDGDGKADLAVFDSYQGYWYVFSLANGLVTWQTAWGWPGAMPPGGRY